MLLGMCCPTQSVYAAGNEEGLKTESDTTGTDTDGTGTTSEESADKGASGEGTTMEDGADSTQSESSEGQDAEEDAGESEDGSSDEDAGDAEAESAEDAVVETADAVNAPHDLKINLLTKPYGVTADQMSFSWEEPESDSMQTQSAYRIVMTRRKSDLRKKNYVYDTGWVESSQNTSVLLDLSASLEDNELYYWQVQIKNGEGAESALSEAQAFSTEVGGCWKSTKGIWGSSGQKVVMLRSLLERPKNVEKAVISITASSAAKARQYVYNLYINGEEVGIGPVRQNGSQLYYDSYDITDSLKEGKNVIGVINYSEDAPAFLCQITYYMEDGSQQIVMNSDSNRDQWKVLDADSIYIGSDTTSIGTWAYVARRDNLNANKFPFGWENTGYNASSWKSVSRNSVFDSYQLKSSQMDRMKRYEVKPESVTKISGNDYLIDFGKEIIGGIRLDLSCSARTVQIEYGEELNEDQTVRSKLAAGNLYKEAWTLKSGQQSLSGIGMKTFRYVKITNLPAGFSKDNITGLMIRQGFDEDASDFQSSNQVLNDVYDMCKYTSKATTQDIYVDSQNRERVAYEGDALITALTSYSYSATSTSAKATAEYLLSNTTWPAEYSVLNISLIYQNYMYTGDRRDLAESYALLKEKILDNYFDESAGLMRNVVNGTVTDQRVMTDWPMAERDGYAVDKVEYNSVFNAVCVGGYADMATIAEILGYEEDRAYYQGLSDTIRANMLSRLYNSETGRFWDGLDATGAVVEHATQHATAYALAYGIYDSQEMADRMCDSIESDGELRMSLYGSFFLLQGLYNAGHGDLARKIMSNPDSQLGVKSWAYMMYGQKATITTEFWENIGKTNMTMCHAWGSTPGNMLVRGMFGIQPTSPGFDSFQVKLQPGGLEQASVKIPTLKGQICASYQMDGSGGISGELTVPANSTATLYVPCETRGTLVIDGNPVNAEWDGQYLVYQIGAGTHSYQASVGILPDDSEWVEEDVVYTAYRDGRWTEDCSNLIEPRNPNSAKLEAVRLSVKNQSVSGEIQYAAYMQGSGWQDWVSDGTDAGNAGGGKRVEAFRVQLSGELAEKYDVYYRAYVEGYGWLDWASNGETAGTTGYSKAIYKIQATLVEKGGKAPGDTANSYKSTKKTISYTTHVQGSGWQSASGDGETSGTVGSGKRLEGIRISLDSSISGSVEYATHVQGIGWQDYVKDGAMSGTSGQSKRLEAIKIKLSGQAAEEYDVYYRVHVQSFGWLDWAKNGEAAGSEGYGKRLEAIQIKLVKKGQAAPGATSDIFRKAQLGYQTHIQGVGWQEYMYDGLMSGTSGQSKRLEAIRIRLNTSEVSGGIRYKTHVQGIGWQDWVSNGKTAGTSGQSKRLEAIEIVLVEKGGEAPGSEIGAFVKK